MRIEEAVECMSKINLHRILDSYTKDTIKPDETTSRKRIIADRDILQTPDNIDKRMQFSGVSFDTKALAFFLIETLLGADRPRQQTRTKALWQSGRQ